MKHISVYFETSKGKAGFVYSGKTFEDIEKMLDLLPRAHKTKNGQGLIGYIGCNSFREAVEDCLAWEDKDLHGWNTLG